MALVAAGICVQSLPGAGLDRDPRIRAIRARADAFVSSQRRTQNFGAARQLVVDASPTRRAYIRFKVDLTSGNVSHVSLLIYSRTGSRMGYEVRLVEDYWRERRINFLNAPDPSSSDFVSSGPLRTRAWKAVDVTSLIGYESTATSFALTTRSVDTIELASRETGFRGPRLVVEREESRGGSGATTTEG